MLASSENRTRDPSRLKSQGHCQLNQLTYELIVTLTKKKKVYVGFLHVI